MCWCRTAPSPPEKIRPSPEPTLPRECRAPKKRAPRRKQFSPTFSFVLVLIFFVVLVEPLLLEILDGFSVRELVDIFDYFDRLAAGGARAAGRVLFQQAIGVLFRLGEKRVTHADLSVFVNDPSVQRDGHRRASTARDVVRHGEARRRAGDDEFYSPESGERPVEFSAHRHRAVRRGHGRDPSDAPGNCPEIVSRGRRLREMHAIVESDVIRGILKIGVECRRGAAGGRHAQPYGAGIKNAILTLRPEGKSRRAPRRENDRLRVIETAVAGEQNTVVVLVGLSALVRFENRAARRVDVGRRDVAEIDRLNVASGTRALRDGG